MQLHSHAAAVQAGILQHLQLSAPVRDMAEVPSWHQSVATQTADSITVKGKQQSVPAWPGSGLQLNDMQQNDAATADTMEPA